MSIANHGHQRMDSQKESKTDKCFRQSKRKELSWCDELKDMLALQCLSGRRRTFQIKGCSYHSRVRSHVERFYFRMTNLGVHYSARWNAIRRTILKELGVVVLSGQRSQ